MEWTCKNWFGISLNRGSWQNCFHVGFAVYYGEPFPQALGVSIELGWWWIGFYLRPHQ